MLVKIVTFLALGVVLYGLIRGFDRLKPKSTAIVKRDPRAADPRAKSDRKQPEDLVKCPQCGAFRSKFELCACEESPTP